VISSDLEVSGECPKEYSRALEHDMRLAPLVRHDAPPEALPATFCELNWILWRETADLTLSKQL
jgi:hypothetical protein